MRYFSQIPSSYPEAEKIDATVNSGEVSAEDVEQYSDAIAPLWQVRFNQLSKGTFHADLKYLKTDTFMVYTEQWNRRVHVEGESPEGYLMLGANSAPDCIWDGSPLGLHQLAIKHSKAAVDFTISGSHTVILLPYENLETLIGKERADALLSNQHRISCNSTVTTAFNRAVHQLVNDYHQSATADQSARIAAQADQEIGKLLNRIIHSQTAENQRTGRNLRRDSLTRALQITRNLRRPLAIPELAKRVGVSQRTLDSAFQDSFSIPPARYLRRLRLNQVRRELRRSWGEATTVTKVANNWGFTELGRMAVEYRQLFGESPSQTLAASPLQGTPGLPARIGRAAIQGQLRQQPSADAKTA